MSSLVGKSAAIRDARGLAACGLVAPERLGELRRVADNFAVALTEDVLGLIDPSDPNDPIAAQFVPSTAELETAPEERADPIGDQRWSPIGSARSSGAVSSSAVLGTNCAAIGSLGSLGSISPSTSSVSATAKLSATRRNSPSRSGATRPHAARPRASRIAADFPTREDIQQR